MYPAFGARGASWFLGVSEWLIGALIFSGFWNKKLGILGALGSCHIHQHRHYYPIYAEWLGCLGRGVPAMAGNVPFLMKDLVLLAASVYLLRQDVIRVSRCGQAPA